MISATIDVTHHKHAVAKVDYTKGLAFDLRIKYYKSSRVDTLRGEPGLEIAGLGVSSNAKENHHLPVSLLL